MGLFGPEDACSLAVTGLYAGDFSNITDLYAGDCPARFQAFTTGCAPFIENEVIPTL